MKKLISVFVILGLVVVIAATAAFAAGSQGRGIPSCPFYSQGGNYTDQDGDGVCDWYAQGGRGQCQNQDGTCGYYQEGCHARRQFCRAG